MTRSTRTAILLLSLFTPIAPLVAQTPSAAPATGTITPSAILGSALGKVQQAIDILRPEKWKAPAAVTAESASDVASIQRDLTSTLPPLLTAADAAPGSVPQLLPAYRNIEALYDVLVRVTQTSILAAPAAQSANLQQASATLQQARRDLGDLLQAASQAQDRQLHEAQAQLRTAQSTPLPVAAVCPPPPTPAKKAKPHAKVKPATTQPPSN